MSYHFNVPLRVPVTKSAKFFSLNLNQYRNTHFHVLNKSKIVFKEIITNDVQKLPKMQRINIVLRLFPKTKRLCDLDNVLSIVAKYTQDVLVTLGKIPDDSYNYIPELDFRFGDVDKDNPRVEISITEI
jgi:Holliday junction resolvase RusA-like endonuclease